MTKWTTELEEENWIDYIKSSTEEAIDKMDDAKIRCWIKTHERIKWRMALRIARSPSERWMVRAAEWNTELSSRYKTYRAIGRPRRRWEDDINEFLKLKKKARPKTLRKAKTNHGLKQRKTVENGIYLKKTTQ